MKALMVALLLAAAVCAESYYYLVPGGNFDNMPFEDGMEYTVLAIPPGPFKNSDGVDCAVIKTKVESGDLERVAVEDLPRLGEEKDREACIDRRSYKAVNTQANFEAEIGAVCDKYGVAKEAVIQSTTAAMKPAILKP